MRSFISSLIVAVVQLAALSNAAPFQPSVASRQDAGRLVFAHFMVGIGLPLAMHIQATTDLPNWTIVSKDGFRDLD